MGDAFGPGPIDQPSLEVDDSFFDDGRGRGLLVSLGPLTVTPSAIYSNTATGDGGGIWVAEGALTLENSTVSHNTAEYGAAVTVDIAVQLR